MPAPSEFRTKLLSRQTGQDDYKIYRAGLEWDLTDPIVIESAEDFKSAPRWRERLTPYHHQVSNLITFCRRLPVTLLADDVGLGKTISAGLIMSELISRSRLSKALIVCPKLLCPQWKEELDTKFDIPAEIATGRALLHSDPGETGAVVTTYNSARLYLEELPEDRFEMLILDEAHKLRNLYGVPKTPQVAKRFRKALQDRRFRFVLMLTATPIQNRLWDLYSLVDLLTVARGHENPFGKEGMFARHFIADEKDKARQLKAEAKDEFRNIVYGYMSRVRRGDAKLYFPDRVIQMHQVNPTAAEIELINVIAKPIQKMNRLAQIGILQALASSPDALSAQLTNMARNGTVPPALAAAVKSIVATMPPSAKLDGLGRLIDQLKKQNPDRWRLVIFTTRRETQTTIQKFIEAHGLKVGIINGNSGERNQETITRFRKNPPECHIIVSTEAGSEGVNLQVANVLVNYDLPWNPMIVEQRIGRVQRLASEHAHVSIFNIMLRGTFEEYIVGRLVEKLQMAAHAIGDIEALLQGSDISDSDEDSGASFEDRILTLILSALSGKDTDAATRLAEQSIENAKAELEREEANINAMLGSMDGAEYVGPRAPNLPPPERSMDVPAFTLSALPMLGARLTPAEPGLYLAEEKSAREYICFEPYPDASRKTTRYAAASPPFQRLVKRVITSALHNVEDVDRDATGTTDAAARRWVESQGASFVSAKVKGVQRSFVGSALLRVRATVAHDSYERIVACACEPGAHTRKGGPAELAAVPQNITDPKILGIDIDQLRAAGERDEAIAEFSRFYLERREQEVRSAGTDERKRKKLEDDFTPRIDITLVGLEGNLSREVKVQASYAFDASPTYQSEISIRACDGTMVSEPPAELCGKSGRTVPKDCIATCEVTAASVMRHFLNKSDVSGRMALPEFTSVCALSGKRVLNDELEISGISGRAVAKGLLKTCAASGKRAEPEYFGTCAFTDANVLKTELATSQVSGKAFRKDELAQCAASGRIGHRSEFVECSETHRTIAPSESESCEVTGKVVRKGILEPCAETGKRVLSSELDRCSATGQRVLKRLLVNSSVSQAPVLERAAIRSQQGKFCIPTEAGECFWSGRLVHPDDLRTCTLTGLPIHAEFTANGDSRLRPLVEMLDGVRRTADEGQIWNDVATRVSSALKGKRCRVEAAILSPARRHLATCAEVRSMLGMRVRQAGAIYNLADHSIVGHITEGSRGSRRWEARS
jgi:superfamily II DNA or RNA helicase